MTWEIDRLEDRVVLHFGEHTVAVAWFQNRFHHHPRIYRLAFDGFENAPARILETSVVEALREARTATESQAPLLFRTTIDTRSRMLHALRQYGFLETRRVYKPVLRLEQSHPHAARGPRPIVDGESLRLASFDLERRDALVDVLTEVYARTSRLDPATPERLDRDELWTAFTRDLDPGLSTCAFLGNTLVATCTVYRSDTQGEVEFGPFGVTRTLLPSHRAITLAMLRRSIERARTSGVQRLRAEIDSDDPWTLYTCAELPFRYDAESLTLTFVPAWQT